MKNFFGYNFTYIKSIRSGLYIDFLLKKYLNNFIKNSFIWFSIFFLEKFLIENFFRTFFKLNIFNFYKKNKAGFSNVLGNMIFIPQLLLIIYLI